MIRVEKEGDATDLSAQFSNTADSAWNNSKATFQFFVEDNRLRLLSHTYFDDLAASSDGMSLVVSVL